MNEFPNHSKYEWNKYMNWFKSERGTEEERESQINREGSQGRAKKLLFDCHNLYRNYKLINIFHLITSLNLRCWAIVMFCDAKYEIVYIILGLRRNIDWNTDQKSFFLCWEEGRKK